MSNSLNLMMNMNIRNIELFSYELRMIDNYDNNACSWFDFLTIISEKQMTTDWIKKIARMIGEEDDKTNIAFHCSIMIEANLICLNRLIGESCDVNDNLFRTLQHNLTYLFNQL